MTSVNTNLIDVTSSNIPFCKLVPFISSISFDIVNGKQNLLCAPRKYDRLPLYLVPC